ncbi:MAG: lactate utilization protein [Eubacterium sp.]|nr:lactate utilization protein [Eubacterium sp.]
MDPKKAFYKTQAETIIKNLNKRRMYGCYCETVEEAVEKALSFVKENDTVSFGGSMTLTENQILDRLRGREDINLLDRGACQTPEEIEQVYRGAFSSDVYFMSTNAITIDGRLVNTDGTGNRIAALIYGPKSVVIVAGMNKVAPDLESAQARVRDIASPPNCIRLNRKTPCALTGKCGDCLGDDSICSQNVVTRRSAIVDRIKVILVGEELGY